MQDPQTTADYVEALVAATAENNAVEILSDAELDMLSEAVDNWEDGFDWHGDPEILLPFSDGLGFDWPDTDVDAEAPF